MIVVTRHHVWIIRVGIGWVNAGLLGFPLLTPPKEVLAQLPRDTRIGPVERVWGGWDWRRWGRATINGERIFVAPRYLKDVEAADSEIIKPQAPMAAKPDPLGKAAS
jgi:hypothetical protein